MPLLYYKNMRKLEVLEDLVGFGDGMSLHELGAKVFGAREMVDVDFEEVLERFVGEGFFGVEFLVSFGVGRIEVEVVKEQI